MSDRTTILALMMSCVVGAGCVEERITGVKGGLYGLPGAKGGLVERASTPSTGTNVQEILEAYHPADPDLTPIEGEPLRYRDPEGDVVVVSKSGQHLIYHVTEMLRRGEHDLLFDWIISAEAKHRYRERFISPRETVQWLAEHEEDVFEFFLLMPQGENTPGVRMTAPRPGVIRLRPELGRKYTQTEFSTLEMIIEEGQCRLLTIY